ncbi:hypothetical protein GIB67_030638 [Kingdonia uniflora]|uniref:Uncharacterized protein n=1 Tax=Kingdonia uniflora TaxID=39325 RepID=A0A7J7LHX7_9MAGN|nr:hypothetical protein GIB67_030638 [Kingdonia uniflora]
MQMKRSLFKRSLSDGNILCESRTPMSTTNIGEKKLDNPAMPERTEGGGSKGLSDSTPEISTCESDLSYSRYTPTMTRRQLFTEMQSNLVYFNNVTSNCSNFVDLKWLSSFGNSCEEESYERSVLLNSPVVGTSTENVVNGITVEITSTEKMDLASWKKDRQKQKCHTKVNKILKVSVNFLRALCTGLIFWLLKCSKVKLETISLKQKMRKHCIQGSRTVFHMFSYVALCNHSISIGICVSVDVVLCKRAGHSSAIAHPSVFFLVVDWFDMVSLKDIVPAAQNNVSAQFILLEKDNPVKEGPGKTCLTLVADETASVHFQLCDIIGLTNGIFSCVRNKFVLRAGKRGMTEKVGEFSMVFVETLNMSNIQWGPKPSNFRKLKQENVIAP